MTGKSGVAREKRVVGISKFHSLGKCTMPLVNINSDWMSSASPGLYYLRESFKLVSWGVIYIHIYTITLQLCGHGFCAPCVN